MKQVSMELSVHDLGHSPARRSHRQSHGCHPPRMSPPLPAHLRRLYPGFPLPRPPLQRRLFHTPLVLSRNHPFICPVFPNLRKPTTRLLPPPLCHPPWTGLPVLVVAPAAPLCRLPIPTLLPSTSMSTAGPRAPRAVTGPGERWLHQVPAAVSVTVDNSMV